MTSTYTYVEMEIPADLHELIRKKLEQAGYDHAILEGPDGRITLDMRGVGLVPEDPDGDP